MVKLRMKPIPTLERLREVLRYDPETGIFTWLVMMSSRALPNQAAGCRSNGYRQIRLDGGIYLSHRLAWLYVYGEWPDKEIDHVNGDKSDNRIANLRLATRTQNCCNVRRRRTNKSGTPGVSWFPQTQRWRARIVVDRREVSLGYFRSKQDAIAARTAAVKHYYGEFGRL
jgi:hypothetical protein